MIVMKGKKGQVLVYGLIAGLILAIILNYIGSTNIKREFGIIGESSLSLIESSIEAEKILFYTDQSAKFSAQQTIIKLAEKGGYAEKNGCGDYLEYRLWTALDEKNNLNKCFPDREIIKNNFIFKFNEKLNQYLLNYPESDIPKDNYEIELKEKEDKLDVIGLAVNDLKITIGDGEIEEDPKINGDTSITGAAIIMTKQPEQSEFYGIYSIKPSFRANTINFLSDYENLVKSSEELMEACKNPEDLILCLNENALDIFSKDNLQLKENCETEEKEKLLEFAEYFESCLESEDKNCVCRENPRKENYNIIKNDNGIVIEKDSSEGRISINNKDIKLSDDILKFNGEEMFLHKDENGKILAEQDISTSPKCDIKPKTKFRFCFETNNVDYKFALQFPELKQES
jgi:hypothetical protein|tara:strand:- start:11705 stop:12907 length:1203 start_codon:yes stop_codon:yes gene_type:complete